MSRERRKAPSPLGASVLDMLTCALGAAVLLFILKASKQKQDVEDAEGAIIDTARAITLAESAQRDTAAVIGRLQARIRTAADQTVFGLPRVEGNLAIVIDGSGSMTTVKVAFARRVVATLLEASQRIESVRLTVFAEEPKVVFDWGPPSMVPRALEGSSQTAGGTNVLGALREAITAVLLRGGGTVLLISDGLQNHPEEISVNEVLKRIDFHPSVTIHSLGLFGATDSAATLGNLLRAISLEGRGEFVAFVVEEREMRPLVPPVRIVQEAGTVGVGSTSSAAELGVPASDEIKLPTYDGTAIEHQKTRCEQLRIEVADALYSNHLADDDLDELTDKLANCDSASAAPVAASISYVRPTDIEESFPTRFDQ